MFNLIKKAAKNERENVAAIIASQIPTATDRLITGTIPVSENGELAMDVYSPHIPPSEKAPIIIDVHGGGLIAGQKEQNRNLGIFFANQGYLTFVPDYRLVPETNIFGQISDILRAFDMVYRVAARFRGDLNQVFVVADSAGAFLAAQAYAVAQCPNAMRELLDELDMSLPAGARKLHVQAMGLQSGVFSIHRGKVGLLANDYMKRGWRKKAYAPYIYPENYSRFLPATYLITSDGDFLKRDSVVFSKFLRQNWYIPNQLEIIPDKSVKHADTALHPETEYATMANLAMLSFFKKSLEDS